MDIRVAAYSPSVTVSTATRTNSTGGTTASAYVQNAAQSGPVTATAAIRPTTNGATSQLAANPNEGYTDTVRGSLINILA